MTATLPTEVQQVFDRFVTTEFTTVDGRGQPITWPLTPYYQPGDPCIDVTTGLGYPKKANDARANPKVALLFSDPTGCGMDDAPQVLVQGTAQVDDRDLDANRERYRRELVQKLPGTKTQLPPKFLQRAFDWYFTRVYVQVRPERVYVWSDGDVAGRPDRRVYISGDTLWYEGLRAIRDRVPELDVAVLHLGGTRVLLRRLPDSVLVSPEALLPERA